MPRAPKPLFFDSPQAFRAWLEVHHAQAPALLVGFWKLESGRPSLTWSESVDQALCFGWIDGVRRSVDGARYMIRFTPRRPGSNWSAINIAKVEALESAGLMRPAGRAAFAARIESKSRIYSYEQRADITLAPDLQRRLEQHRKAWTFFQAQPPGYRRLATFRVMSAKQDATRVKRLDLLIAQWAEGRRDR